MMNKKLDEDLYKFAGDGADKKDEIFNNIMQKVNSTFKPKIRLQYKKYVTAAVAACLLIAIIGNFNVIADSINKLVNTFFPAENIMMNELNENTLQEIIDARIAADIDFEDIEDDGSIVYQILYKEVETPCYVYLHYYRGYLKALILDKKTKNIKEVEEWLRNYGGIVAKVAETPKEAEKFFEEIGNAVSIRPAEIKQAMGDGCMMPVYLPDGRNGNIVQYNENISNVNITYFYPGKTDIGGNNYVALGIADTNNQFGKNIIANLAVSKNIKIIQINGWDVYISDGYYVWKTDGFAYVLYSTCTTHEENIKIIENMQ